MPNKERNKLVRESKPLMPKEEIYREGDIFERGRKKLKPGGVASISHRDFILDKNLFERDIKNILSKLPVSFEIVDNDSSGKMKYQKVLRIIKSEEPENEKLDFSRALHL